MHCLYCGKGFRLASRLFNDPDFCRPPHRWKFHKRLEAAIHFIRRSTELNPIGQAGFRGSETVFFDYLFQSTVLGAAARAPQFVMPRWRLGISGEGLPVERFTVETSSHRARVEQFSVIMTQLRDEVARRRSDQGGSGGRNLAPVVEFRPAPVQALRMACT